MRRVVVFPQPEGPNSEKNSPSLMSRERSSTAATSPNCLVTRSRRTSTSGTRTPLKGRPRQGLCLTAHGIITRRSDPARPTAPGTYLHRLVRNGQPPGMRNGPAAPPSPLRVGEAVAASLGEPGQRRHEEED